MMLSSAGRREDAQRCREAGISAYMTKPIRRAELMDSILRALRLKASENEPPQLVTQPSRSRCARRLQILLAEDNLVNQMLAVRLLEKCGHAVTVAGNGCEPLAALERQSFGVVLMDVQMPEMDGLEATKAIRAKERSTGGHVPIVAMTAGAMKGDRERCLEAGMDHYVSKPLHPKVRHRRTTRSGQPQRLGHVGRRLDGCPCRSVKCFRKCPDECGKPASASRRRGRTWTMQPGITLETPERNRVAPRDRPRATTSSGYGEAEYRFAEINS